LTSVKTIRALEVMPVHVLHRPHLAHAAAIAAACTAMAIVLTLLFANTLNDFGSTSTLGPAAAPTSAHSTSTQPGWNLNPFTSLLRRPAATPWSK
jgi:hypothetical protein